MPMVENCRATFHTLSCSWYDTGQLQTTFSASLVTLSLLSLKDFVYCFPLCSQYGMHGSIQGWRETAVKSFTSQARSTNFSLPWGPTFLRMSRYLSSANSSLPGVRQVVCARLLIDATSLAAVQILMQHMQHRYVHIALWHGEVVVPVFLWLVCTGCRLKSASASMIGSTVWHWGIWTVSLSQTKKASDESLESSPCLQFKGCKLVSKYLNGEHVFCIWRRIYAIFFDVLSSCRHSRLPSLCWCLESSRMLWAMAKLIELKAGQ